MDSKVLGVIGYPIEHSMSPSIHNKIAEDLKDDFIYFPFKVEPLKLESFIKGMKQNGIAGINVTIPHKINVMQYLDEVVGQAAVVGAVNTVKVDGEKLVGYNTDGDGFVTSFNLQAQSSLKDKKVVILGSGGAARSIAAISVKEGADVYISSRNEKTASELCKDVGSEYIKDIACIGKVDVLINATPVGMHPNADGCPIEQLDILKGIDVVFDTIYNPFKTRLLEEAEKRGCKAINGLGMLIFQAFRSYEIWTDRKIDDRYKLETLKIFEERKNK